VAAKKADLPHPVATDHLAALADLLAESHAEPAKLFEHGLSLLMDRLKVDRALLTRASGLGYEVFWWAARDGEALHKIFKSPEKGFCPWVMAHPERPLVIKDAKRESRWSTNPAWTELGIRSYVGVALIDAGIVTGCLCVQYSRPRIFDRGAISLVKAMGHLLSKTLETEHLKQELQATRDALELSSAVVEDSALQSSRSGLPNRHYLEIWLRSTVFLARRRQESMALILWNQPMERGLKSRLQTVSAALRGEDLMVELTPDHYLLLMPHTTPVGAEILLARIQETLGRHPAGGVVWDPEGADLHLKGSLTHAARALAEGRTRGLALVWHASQNVLAQ
jgi:GAF domain-containing protein